MSQTTQPVKRAEDTPSFDRYRLRSRRTAADMSVRELARRSGVSDAYVSQLETGQRDNPSLKAMAALARELGCQVTDLMPDEPNGGEAA